MNKDKERFRKIIAAAVERTFEEMTFLEVKHIREPKAISERSAFLKTTLLVHDPFPGELCLKAPRSLVVGVARCLFSIGDEDIVDPSLLDLLAELLNTIAGSILNEITPKDATFRLGLPETGTECLTDSDDQMVECCFDVGGEELYVAASGEALLARGESC